MRPQAIKLSYLELDAVDLDGMAHHYTKIVGLGETARANGSVWFGCGTDRFSLGLRRADRKGYRVIGFQIAGDIPLADILASLKAEGIEATLKSDAMPGVPSLVEIRDPDGHTVHLVQETETAVAPFTEGIRPDKLGHVALFSQNPQRALEFYSRTLGFRLSDWLLDIFVFMRCNADHHVLNFLKPPTARQGLFHVAFELRDWAHVGIACDALARHRIPIVWGPGRHGTGHNIFTYHRDPDGNIVELFADIDRMSNEAIGAFDPRPHHRDAPQRPKVWSFEEAHLWGPPPPPDFWD